MENGLPACMLICLSGGWETENLFGVVLWLHTNACNVKQRHFVIIALWMCSGARELGLSQICSKICPICSWEFGIFTYYALHFSHYACVMLKDYSIF